MSSIVGDRGELAPLLSPRDPDELPVAYGATLPSLAREVDGTFEESDDEGLNRPPPANSLPPKQLILLFLLRFSAPIAFSQIFPYVNEMMANLDASIDPSQVGYYSGLVESVFAFSQFFTILRWGMLSDRIGRKPVILICFLGVMIFNIVFGFSKSLTWALAARAAAGALSGGSTALLSAVGDMADEASQAHAYSILGLASTLGSILGPAVGGTFADPQYSFPNSLGKIELFRKYPYLLPCLASSALLSGAIVACALWFRETLPPASMPYDREVRSLLEQEIHSETDTKQSAWEIATSPAFAPILAACFFLNLSGNASNAVFSLFAYTPVEKGGLSQEPVEIGMAIASSGLLASAIQIMILPVLQQQLGTVAFFRGLMALWPVLYICFPFVNEIALLTSESSDTTYLRTMRSQGSLVLWSAIFALLMLQRFASMAYPLNLILTKNAAPSQKVLGTVFGLSSVAGCLARIVSPTLVSSLFAFSVEQHVMDGNFVWFAMTAISIVGLYVSWRVKE